MTLFIEGSIVTGDDERFRQMVVDLIGRGFRITDVRIYSPGGQVGPAVHIGRQIRTLGLTTSGPTHWRVQVGKKVTYRKEIFCLRREFDKSGRTLPAHMIRGWARNLTGGSQIYKNDDRCICASSCFLIWTAGVGRGGTWFGVHRPTFDPAEYGKLSPEEAEQRYSRMLDEVKAYLAEMGIPESIARRMMAASSQDMHYLTIEEAESLNNESPALSELVIAKCGDWPTTGKKSLEA